MEPKTLEEKLKEQGLLPDESLIKAKKIVDQRIILIMKILAVATSGDDIEKIREKTQIEKRTIRNLVSVLEKNRLIKIRRYDKDLWIVENVSFQAKEAARKFWESLSTLKRLIH